MAGVELSDDRVQDMIDRARLDGDRLDVVFSSSEPGGRFRMYADALEGLLRERNMYRERCLSAVRSNDELARIIEVMRAKARKKATTSAASSGEPPAPAPAAR
jgi:hypothetical protein